MALLLLRCCAVLVLGSGLLEAQSRIVRPQTQLTPNNSSKHQHVATLRSSDSSEGSRVAVTSDQSLSDYEAYRRGDRFYVKIPAADVPRAEAVRGRGFADVKAQRSGDSTVVSFRLQPGATAHVEQRLNRLDVVIALPGARASTTVPGVNTNNRVDRGTVARIDSTRKLSPTKQNAAAQNSAVPRSSTPPARNNAERANTLTARDSGSMKPINSAEPGAKTLAAAPSPAASPGLRVSATPAATPQPSPTAALPTATPAQKSLSAATASPAGQPTGTAPLLSSQTGWTNFKERVHYWILLAQLNPIPVSAGAAVLFLLIAMLLFHRRRGKTTRRARPRGDESKAKSAVVSARTSANASTEPQAPPVAAEATMPEAAVPTEMVAAAPLVNDSAQPPATERAPISGTAVAGARQLRVNRVGEEVKKLMAGEDYDRSVVASEDRDTRQLVGAELLSALVGRNAERRERARVTFMQHGYFDDATRDLRIGESPNERAAAARRLSFVRDREATPHLIGALDDSSPDVRRAAVEALMDLRDPSAIGPLNSLLQTESDRKVPRPLIKHAIEACATSAPDEGSPLVSTSVASPIISESSYQPFETEREVIEL